METEMNSLNCWIKNYKRN